MLPEDLEDDLLAIESRKKTRRWVAFSTMWIVWLFHLLMFLVGLAVFGTDTYFAIVGGKVTNSKEKFPFGRHMVFLTEWGLLFSVLFFGYSLFCDLCVLRRKTVAYSALNRKSWDWVVPELCLADEAEWVRCSCCPEKGSGAWVLNIRDSFFAVLFPMANVIGIIFWAVLASHVSWNNSYRIFSMTWTHGATLISVWVEMFMVHHYYKSVVLEMVGCIGLGMIYLGWNYLCYSQNHVFPYPFQEKLIWWHGVILYCGLFMFVGILYFIGRTIAYCYWSRLHTMAVLKFNKAVMLSFSVSSLNEQLFAHQRGLLGEENLYMEGSVASSM